MVVKSIVYQGIGNAVALLLLAAFVSWWTSPSRRISATTQSDRVESADQAAWRTTPLTEPRTWVLCGAALRWSAVAASALFALALVLAPMGGPYPMAAWLACAACAIAFVAAILFLAMHPPWTGLKLGFAPFCLFVGAPLGGLMAVVVARSR